MSIFDLIFGNKDRKNMLGHIEHNANLIENDESRTRLDAEYLSICLILDDLANRPDGKKGHQLVMEILSKEYSQHHNHVMTYLAVQSGIITLKPDAEAALMKRHQNPVRGLFRG